MTNIHYQRRFSENHPQIAYNRKAREKKAKTITAVLHDFLGNDLRMLSLLDVGCSTGIITDYLSNYFGEVVGIDADEPAIQYAKENFTQDRVRFHFGSAMDIPLPKAHFDVVTCAHVYEHVPDADRLMAEIHRVLKPGGICYFAAGNRINLMEPHHRLPLLSVLPRPLAHICMRASGKGSHYPERHLSYWGLRKLTRRFYHIDYTRKIIEQPKAFSVEYMIRRKTIKGKLAEFIVHYAYCLCPGYIWLLRKGN
jgi:2-polyprenyl-3-methyl-5-hydroxy-6-metoxy-1,4-benzoquinol methylase